jgi:hypothetical protein
MKTPKQEAIELRDSMMRKVKNITFVESRTVCLEWVRILIEHGSNKSKWIDIYDELKKL